MIPYQAIQEFVVNGIKFSYESYDHKKAMEEIRELERQGKPIPYGMKNFFEFVNSCFGIPDEIKQNHIVWRTGKLREVYFNSDGKMYRFKIGHHWYKNFYIDDFGVKVKPMIFKSDDKYNLIAQGLAVEEKM
jgi:hypothetical protein